MIAVLGGNGVYARHLLPRLTATHRVRAIVRRAEAGAPAAACGAEVQIADIFDHAALTSALAGCELCINLATSLPGPSGRGDYATNDRVRRDGVPILVAACADAAVGRLLQQSVAMVAGDAAADGDDLAARAIAATLAMEDSVRRSPLDWAILRGGLFYGPGTAFDDDWFARAAAGRLRLPGDGTDFVSLIHIADMAAATHAAVERWPSRETLNVVDDRPVQWVEMFSYIAASTGAAPPPPGGRIGFPSFRVDNRQARERLGWAPLYGDYRAGLAR